MSDSEETCRGNYGDCPNRAVRDGLCWGHVKADQRNKSINVPLKQRPASRLEKAMEAGIRFLEADGEDEYERAEKEWKKAIAAAGTEARAAVISELTRKAMAEIKKAGRHVGRPKKVDPARVRALLENGMSVPEVAAALDVHPKTVRRNRGNVLKGTKGTPFCPSANHAT